MITHFFQKLNLEKNKDDLITTTILYQNITRLYKKIGKIDFIKIGEMA